MGIVSKVEEKGFKVMKKMPHLVREPVVKFAAGVRKRMAKRLKTPIILTLYVTNRCNAKCSHCFYASEINRKCEELTLDQITKIAKSLKHPLKTLMITGGEPFLRNDMADICKAFLKKNRTRRISLDTNGLLTKKIVKDVKDILDLKPGTLHVQVSIDGPQKVHDKIRKVKGCHRKAMSTVRELEKLLDDNPNFQLSIMTTVSKDNFRLLRGFTRSMARKHPKVLHKFNIIRGARTGTYGLPESITSELDTVVDQIPPKDLLKLFKELSKRVKENKDDVWANAQKLKWVYSVEMLKKKKRILECMAGYTFGVIYPNGDVAICEPTVPFANLAYFDYDFHRLWQSQNAQIMRKMTRGCYCIHPCNLIDSMAYDSNTILKILEASNNRKSKKVKKCGC